MYLVCVSARPLSCFVDCSLCGRIRHVFLCFSAYLLDAWLVYMSFCLYVCLYVSAFVCVCVGRGGTLVLLTPVDRRRCHPDNMFLRAVFSICDLLASIAPCCSFCVCALLGVLENLACVVPISVCPVVAAGNADHVCSYSKLLTTLSCLSYESCRIALALETLPFGIMLGICARRCGGLSPAAPHGRNLCLSVAANARPQPRLGIPSLLCCICMPR